MTTFWRSILPGIALVQAACIIALASILLNIPAPPQPVHKADFDHCMAGWRKTIADWNAATEQLNAILRFK